ncbi:MAG TPA: porin family protein [Longimicrobiales bacterium]
MNKAKLFGAMIVAAGMFAYAVPASAQTIGFKVGPTWSNIDAEGDDDGLDRLQSIGGGGFVRFGMMGLALQAEVLAVTKGTKESEEGIGELKTKLDYIEVPLLARFSMGSTMPFSPYIMVGPSFAFNYGCTAEFESDDEDVLASDEVDCDDEDAGLGIDIKSLDIGATGVLGFEFKAGPGAILVEGRYTHGFMDIIDTDAEDAGAKNRQFGVMAGYSFTLR